MTEDKDVEKYLIYLDDILAEIFNSKNNQVSIYTIFKNLYGSSINTSDSLPLNFGSSYNLSNIKDLTIDDFFNIHEILDYEYFKLSNALNFLESEGYIFRINTTDYKINFKGILQFSKTFHGQYKKEQDEKWLNKTNIILTLCLALFALITSLFFQKC